MLDGQAAPGPGSTPAPAPCWQASTSPTQRLWQAGAAALVQSCVRTAFTLTRNQSNPHLDITLSHARELLRRMRAAPRPLVRPVLILNGYRGWEALAWAVRDTLASATSGRHQDFLVISYALLGDTEAITRRILDRYADARRNDSPIDVVGISMGGVLARWCALSPVDRVHPCARDRASTPPHPGHLPIARLFTLASPHTGARLASWIRPDPAARDLREGSAWMQALAEHHANGRSPRSMRCYAHLGDTWVGATRTAPAGENPVWHAGTMAGSHFAAARNPVFLADIARHLRGEEPVCGPASASRPPRE